MPALIHLPGLEEQAANAALLQLTDTALGKQPAGLIRGRQLWVQLPAQLTELACLCCRRQRQHPSSPPARSIRCRQP